MKWLFLFIVLLNAAFLSWHSFVQDTTERTTELVYAPPVSEKVYLLSERVANDAPQERVNSDQKVSLEEALKKAMDQSKTDQNIAFCARIETEKTEDAKQVVQALTAFNWAYEKTEVSGKRSKFWLYIAAPETPEMARNIVSDLSSKSIDSFVINRAEMKNRISLGLYSSSERAEQARQRIQDVSGYQVDIYEHLRTVPLEQFDVTQSIQEKEWERFVSRLDLSKMMIKLEKKSC
ncbi:MAG: SPOR domain-containing protein [Marinomonas hwangdonensis]|nr:SPOR domain-containing protein [Marinomonas hwangdonensis]